MLIVFINISFLYHLIDCVLIDSMCVNGVLIDCVLIDSMCINGVLIDCVLTDSMCVNGALIDCVLIDSMCVNGVLISSSTFILTQYFLLYKDKTSFACFQGLYPILHYLVAFLKWW